MEIGRRPVTRQSKKVKYECSGTEYLVDQHYQVVKQIGVGAYGFVAAGVNRASGQKVAIKKVHNAFSDAIDDFQVGQQPEFFEHGNVVNILDIMKPDSPTNYNDVYIVTELMETDLYKVIYSRQDLSEDHIQYFMYQLLCGVLYIHSANIIHRDLKPSNLLLNKNCDLKICDFGLARGYQFQDDRKTQYVVTRWYRAPQVILNASEYSKAVDIWSVGCIMAELLGRAPLFPGDDYLDQVQRIISVLGTPSTSDMKYIGNEQALKYIRSLPKRSKHSFDKLFPKSNQSALDLLSKLLTFDPEKRITAKQALRHPYFESVRQEEKQIVCDRPFDWAWDDFKPYKELLQRMIYEQCLCYSNQPPKRKQAVSRHKQTRQSRR